MSADATLPLQAGIVGALREDEAVADLLGSRVYDRPPADVAKPYLSIGPVQQIPDLAEDYEGAETSIQLDIWSIEPTTRQVKQIGAAVHDALHGAEIDLDGGRLVSLEIEQTRYLTDPDGVTQHGVLIFTARTEPV